MSGAKVVLVGTGEVVVVQGVHPVADLFPMLDKEELSDLAQSISQRGQEHPVVLDVDDLILDGRNRLAACQLLGIDTLAVRYDGDDPDGYALAVNINRRSMTKGQQAMLIVESGLFPENTQATVAELTGTSQSRIAYALAVHQYAADLAPAVISAARSLNDAYAVARKRKMEGESEDARMAKLASEAPDLSDLVIDGTLTLSEAEARLSKRIQDEQERRERATKSVAEAVTSLWARLDPEPIALLNDWLPEANPHAGRAGIPDLFNTAGLRHVAGLLNQLADLVEAKGGRL